MLLTIIPILLVIISNVFYHIFQKSTPSNINPIFALLITYLTAALVCIAILPFYPSANTITASFKKLNWTSFALGISIVGLELGFLLAYRLGLNISSTSMITNTLVAILLIPIGLAIYNETINTINVIGILTCILGLIAVNYK